MMGRTSKVSEPKDVARQRAKSSTGKISKSKPPKPVKKSSVAAHRQQSIETSLLNMSSRRRASRDTSSREISSGSSLQNTSRNKVRQKIAAKKKRRKSRSKGHTAYCNYDVPGLKVSRWKPLAPGTQSYVRDLMDYIRTSILTKTSPQSLNVVEESLSSLQSRILSEMKTMKAPRPQAHLCNYKNMNTAMNLLEGMLTENTDRLHNLDAEIQSKENIVDDLEEEVKQLKKRPRKSTSHS